MAAAEQAAAEVQQAVAAQQALAQKQGGAGLAVQQLAQALQAAAGAVQR